MEIIELILNKDFFMHEEVLPYAASASFHNLYTYKRGIIIRSTTRCQLPQNLPLQTFSFKGNLHVVDKFRKHVGCLCAQGGKR